MLEQRRAAAQAENSREELFTERYETLLVWALHLTHQKRDSAEDLVQDAFVQFMLARTQLEEIENINGYLRRLLRNMYISRMTRLAQRLHETALSIADYDTFRLGWTAIEPPRRMQAAEQLHQICTYACFRKESSRAGSVLILRFFLDFLPAEIASVLGSSRHCVDQWQRLARREVKLFMKEPGRLRFVGPRMAAGAWSTYPASDCDLMLALRAMIFNSRQGPCLSKEELQAAYTAGHADALSTTELAHIVSCRSCLDTVNTILGLPLLAERYPAEDCYRDEPPRDATGGGGGSGGVPIALPKRFKRQLREIREHKPSELRIVVNGALLSSLRVSSEFSEFDLNLAAGEPIAFIEVLSEQGVQLLFLSVNDAAPDLEQWAELELSNDRKLEVCLRMNDGPRLHVVYNNPNAESLTVNGGATESVLSSPLTIVPRARAKWLLGVLSNTLRRYLPIDERERSSKQTTSLGLLGQTPSVHRRQPWNSPAWLTVVIAAVLVGAFLLYKTNLDRAPVGSELFARAMVAETARASNRVSHRSINLEIRRSSGGAVVSRHSIDVWEDHERRQSIRRLYDENGRLLATAAQGADGIRTVYHHRSGVPQPRGATPDSLLLDLNDVWQLIPSVRDFNALIADPTTASVQTTATGYVVSFETERSIGASRLVKATLTLASSDLHAVEQTLVVQRGDELREYKFVETLFQLLQTKDVAPGVFDIESELAGEGAASIGSGVSGLRKHVAGPPSSTSTTAFASTELEIDVEYLLTLAKANRNEQVALTRSASGSLRVEGVVENDERREEILRVLKPVSNNPAVSIHLWTIAEAAKQQFAEGRSSVQEVEATANTIAVDEELRDYFSRRGLSGEAVDEAVRSYSSRVVNHSYRAALQAAELKRLAQRFAHINMLSVAPDARKKWIEMIRQHADAYKRDLVALHRELQPIFFSETTLNVADDLAIEDDADLARAVERLYRLATANNDAIRQAFTISSQSSAVALRAAQFRRSLEGAAQLSNSISQYSR
jgi:RNA polymerase sigma factor (sigma-70 family)